MLGYLFITIVSVLYTVLEYTNRLTPLNQVLIAVLFGVVLCWFIQSFLRMDDSKRIILDESFIGSNVLIVAVCTRGFGVLPLLNVMLVCFFATDYIVNRVSKSAKSRKTR